MSIGMVDRKLLWGRSHNTCAFPRCSHTLTVNLDDPVSRVLGDAGAVLGEEAHIRSSKLDGPRYDASYPRDKLDRYGNLILLCPTHHALIDKDGGRGFSAQHLETMREDHENALHRDESENARRERELAERVAAAVQVWEDTIGTADWKGLTGGLNYPAPVISATQRSQLFAAAEWLLSRDWPEPYDRLRMAFGRHCDVLRAIAEHISTSFEFWDDREYCELAKSHKRIGWDPALYNELIGEYQLGSAVTYYLTLELTRSANLIISAVRADLDPLYRFDEGVLLMREGDLIITDNIVRAEYSNRSWDEPFPRLRLQAVRDAILEIAKREHIAADEVDPYALGVL